MDLGGRTAPHVGGAPLDDRSIEVAPRLRPHPVGGAFIYSAASSDKSTPQRVPARSRIRQANHVQSVEIGRAPNRSDFNKERGFRRRP